MDEKSAEKIQPDAIGQSEIKPGRYRHFKGNEYEVIGVATHSETLEKYVVYRALYGEKLATSNRVRTRQNAAIYALFAKFDFVRTTKYVQSRLISQKHTARPWFKRDYSWLWIRPAKMWFEIVEVGGKKVPRFTYISQE